MNAATALNAPTAPRDVNNRFSAMSPRHNTLSVIVRTYLELTSVRKYIRDNPRQWALDRDNPSNRLRFSAPTTVA